MPQLTALINAIIYTGKEKLSQKAVLIKDGFITSIVGQHEVPSDADIVDLRNNFLAPGIIDLQIYGAGDEIFAAKPYPDTLRKMEDTLIRQGCTGFYATIATNSPDVLKQAIEAAKQYRPDAKGNFLGLHLEGPFLNTKRSGAHLKNYIKQGAIAQVKEWVEMAEAEIKMMTIAPELQDDEFIAYLQSEGILLSIGHSDATFEQGITYLENIPAVTHLFNAMPPVHHRQPGLVPAVFEKKPYASIVVDGIHVNFAMVKLAKQLLGDRLFLITDAVTETHSGAYPHRHSGTHFTMPDGTLSGSALSMMAAVKNCVERVDIALDEALRMASSYPAQLINHNLTGYIAPGYAANLIAFDAELNTTMSWLKGIPY